MKRRDAVRSIALTTGGLLALPAWANCWRPGAAQPVAPFLAASQEEVLAEMVETLIPATEIPGAKTLGVQNFVQKMVTDCYEPAVQETLKTGLNTTNALAQEDFGRPFPACTTDQRLAILQKLESSPDAARKDFYSLFKSLAIQGYTTSEYVMTNFYKYKMIPGHFYGCVPAPIANR